MKAIHYLFALYFLLIGNTLWASHPNTSFIQDQLCKVNRYWSQPPLSEIPIPHDVVLKTPDDLTQLHLRLVEKMLRQRPTTHLTPQQRTNRRNALDAFQLYWQRKQFPKNLHHSTFTPAFVDDYQTVCAVGYLVEASGAEELKDLVVAKSNYTLVEDMKIPDLEKWAQENGFTLEELKWIQPTYVPEHDFLGYSFANCGQSDASIFVDYYDLIEQHGYEVSKSELYSMTNEQLILLDKASYTYNPNSRNYENLPAGFYKLKVLFDESFYKDSTFLNFYVDIDDESGPNLTAQITKPSCDSPPNGSISLDISGGTPPYKIRWFDATGKYMGNEPTLSNLSGWSETIGQVLSYNYRVEVEDANGCKTFEKFWVYEFDNYIGTDITYPYCGENNGRIRLIEYQADISWEHDSTLHSNTAEDLIAGQYKAFIDFEDGCHIEKKISLPNRYNEDITFSIITESVQSTHCGRIGRIEISIEGDFDGNYLWSHDATLNSPVAENLPKGHYSVMVQNAKGCQRVEHFNLVPGFWQPQVYGSYFDEQIQNAAEGNFDGQIIVNAYNSCDWIYSWSHDTTLQGSTASNLSAGNYTVTITEGVNQYIRNYTVLEEEVIVNIGKLNTEDWKVYPTLVTQNVFWDISPKSSSNFSVRLYDNTGKKLMKWTLNQNDASFLNLSNYPKGLYFLHLESNNLSKVTKIIKQ